MIICPLCKREIGTAPPKNMQGELGVLSLHLSALRTSAGHELKKEEAKCLINHVKDILALFSKFGFRK